jgi:phosphoserine aminotransferase
MKGYKMKQEIFNFSGGPGELPRQCIIEASEGIIKLPELNISILGISHRSETFWEILEECKKNIQSLLNIPNNYQVLFLQGGASLQFSMIPLNFLKIDNPSSDYIVTGYWSKKAAIEATRHGETNIVWSGEDNNFTRIPKDEEYEVNLNSSYFHYVSNETAEGIQFHTIPKSNNNPLICDMSSDFLSRPFDISQYALVYAHAQKNFGPSGVTIVILHNDMLSKIERNLPAMLDYRNHVEKNSIYNTPPVFPIYFTLLVTRWLMKDIGGLETMNEINRMKSKIIYDTIDENRNFYRSNIDKASRSYMNISFTLPTHELEDKFISEAKNKRMIGLKGHRSVGGIRASLYNGMPIEGSYRLRTFMKEFAVKNKEIL